MTTVTTASSSTTTVVVKEKGGRGDPGTNGTDGAGFNQVRKSLLDNPLLHLFKTNELATVSAPLNTDADVTVIRNSTKKIVDRYGVVKNVAIDVLGEEKEGFLIEVESTNLALHSEDFTNVSWNKVNSTAVLSSEVSPLGTAYTITATANGGIMQQVATGETIGDVFTSSFWIKRRSGTGNISIQAGTTTQQVLNVSTEWQRLDFTGDPLTDTNARISIGFQTSGDSVYLLGGQLEELPFATSYIPTVASPVTRTFDDVSTQAYNNTPDLEGSFSFAFKMSNVAIAANQTLLGFTDPERLTLNSGSLFFQGSINNETLAVGLTGNEFIVVTYDGVNVAAYVDGVKGGDFPLSLTKLMSGSLAIGKRASNIQHMNGNLRDLRAYDFTLDQDEVKYLS